MRQSLAPTRSARVVNKKILFREEELPANHDTEDYIRKSVQNYLPVHFSTPLSLRTLPDRVPGKTVPVPHHILIKLSIWGSPTRKRTLSQIIQDIEERYPEMASRGSKRQAWKDSIRHKLSNDDKLVQVRRPQSDPGRGNYWVIHIGQERKKPASRRRRIKKTRRSMSSTPQISPSLKLDGAYTQAPSSNLLHTLSSLSPHLSFPSNYSVTTSILFKQRPFRKKLV